MKENRDRQIKIVVSNSEHEQIANNAISCGRTVSAYIREMALNMCILENDYTCVEQHTAEISAYRNAVTQLIFTIKMMGNYTPADLEYIVDKTNEILKSEKEFLRAFQNHIAREKKLIDRTVRKIVKEKYK